MACIDRRQFLASATALSAAALLPQAAPAAGRTRLILLGTGGGPRPKRENNASAQVVVVDGALYVIDCGDGVARQLVLAGLSLDRLRHVFITHHHSDHNADYGNLLLLSWASGLRTRVDAWGPPPLAKITRLFLEMNAYDIDIRIADEGRVPLVPLIHAHEIARPGLVMQDENVKVTCAPVPHPMVELAYAYRLDTADRSIVISGDTAYPRRSSRWRKARTSWSTKRFFYPPWTDSLRAYPMLRPCGRTSSPAIRPRKTAGASRRLPA